MNAAGSLIGGQGFRIIPDEIQGEAFIWSPAEGMVNLGAYLAARGFDLSGWTLLDALGISADGRTIVGQGLRGSRREGYIASIWPDPACYANRDGSTTAPVLNILDFAAFLRQFAAGSIQANCDGSTGVPALTVNDFVCFVARFGAGCP